MNKFIIFFLIGSLIYSSLLLPTSLENPSINKYQVIYLTQSKEIRKAIDLYLKHEKQIGKSDFDILEKLAIILLEQGAKSDDPEKQLLSIFGSAIAGISPSSTILEAGIKSSNLETQLATVHLIGRLQDDRSDQLLSQAMNSDSLYVRMEAAYQLALQKNPLATGQIEALMYKVPHQLRFFFPSFFALIGSKDAINILKHLLSDSHDLVRIEAILNIAKNGRDDLLSTIRVLATHLNIAEQEACSSALGILKDSKSLPLLKRLSNSNNSNIRLAALKSLYLLGDLSVFNQIEDMALKKDLFAISVLGEIPETEELLAKLLKDENQQIRLNAALSLLRRRDSRCLETIREILIQDTRDLVCLPYSSIGKSLIAWKLIPSALQHAKEEFVNIQGASLEVKEQILRQCLELPEKDFIKLSKQIFESRQTQLIPLLISLLENLETEEVVHLLQEKAQSAGAPLTRAYCNLSLFRLKQKGPYEEHLKDWILAHKKTEMIRFRPIMPLEMRLEHSVFELTAEENSRLLIESYEALAQRHQEDDLSIFLQAIRDGNPNNRYVLAGLLIHALQ